MSALEVFSRTTPEWRNRCKECKGEHQEDKDPCRMCTSAISYGIRVREGRMVRTWAGRTPCSRCQAPNEEKHSSSSPYCRYCLLLIPIQNSSK